MPFKIEKLRPDWKTKNYVLPVTSITLPDEFWNEARISKNAWNEVVAAYRSFDEEIAGLQASYSEIKAAKGDLSEAKQALSNASKIRKETAIEMCKTQSAMLFNNDYENLQQSLQTGLSQAFRTRGTLHFKRGVENINFCKRYGAGGVSFGDLFTESDTREKSRSAFTLRRAVKWESNKSRNRQPVFGRILVGKSRVPVNFHAVWSYPHDLEGAFVKKVALIGRIDRLRKWSWQILITAEREPVREVFSENRPAAAIDLGYRKFEDYIRFGYLADTTGRRFELRLPHTNFENADLRRTLKLQAKYADWKEKNYIKSLEDFFVWDSAQGTAFQETKNKIKAIYEQAVKLEDVSLDEWKKSFAGFVKMRNTGLHKILRATAVALEAGQTEDQAVALLNEIRELIEKQRELDNYYEKEKEFFRGKFAGRRDIMFRQVTRWLAQNYEHLVWEADLKLSDLATQGKKASLVTDAPIKAAAKFRQWTGLYKFRQFLSETDGDLDKQWLLAGEAAYSTTTCDECGEVSRKNGAELILVCPNGHAKDQDDRAATNLLHKTVGGEPHRHSIEVPKHLTKYIVPIA